MKISNKVTPQILTTPSIFQYPITEPEDEKICRICFEESDTDNPLICPCRCAGTIKYIHEKCLKMWLYAQNNSFNDLKCDVCKTQYLMEIKVKKEISCKNAKNEVTSLIVVPPMLLSSLTVLAYVISLIYNAIKYDQSLENSLYLFMLIILCVILSGLLLSLLVKALKRACIVESIIGWNIHSINETSKMDSNHDHEDIELNIENQTITDNLQPYAVNVNRLRRNPLNISFLPNNDFNLAVNSIEREASMV